MQSVDDSKTVPSSTTRTDRLVALTLFFGFAILYWVGRSLTYGPGDSPQHVLSAITWGVSWPPSYPLYVLLGHVAAMLPGSPAGNVNGLTGLFHAASYVLMYLVLRKSRISALPAAIAVTALGFTPLFWYYSENAEVRALNDLLAISAVYFSLRWVENHRIGSLTGLAVSVGLGIGHHPTYLLIAPALIVLLWGTVPFRLIPPLLAGIVVATAVPYLVLGLRLVYGHPAYNLTGAEHFTDVWDLFLRRNLGAPFRVMGGEGLFGPNGFELPRFIQHLHWFQRALITPSAWAIFPLAAAGLLYCFRTRRRMFAFWLLWFFVSAFTFLVLGSQQLRLHDQDFAYAVAVRFYLLPMLALYAFVACGAECIGTRWRNHIHLLLLGLVILIPVSTGWVRLHGKDIVSTYAREMVDETGPSDILILDTDASFFALDYIDLVDHELGNRVLLMPSLFPFAPYRAWLTRRYPTLRIPPAEYMMDWARWRMSNPDKGIYAEVEWKDSMLSTLPGSTPVGVLIRGCSGTELCGGPEQAAERLIKSPVAAYTRRDLYPFSLDIYILKHEREMSLWALDKLGSSNPTLSEALRNRADDILR